MDKQKSLFPVEDEKHGAVAVKPHTGKNFILTTDGSCIGNPGPGGWACVLREGEHVREFYGAEPQTTNNRMELRAVIEGLTSLPAGAHVTLNIDSQYVKQGITSWINKWKQNGWRTSAKQDVLNRDLWEKLDDAVRHHHIEWKWVKGHASHKDNNRCDELAQRAAREQLNTKLNENNSMR